jgi:hypothetical protein
MISETELSALLTEAAEAIPAPDGVDAILEATRLVKPSPDSAPPAPHNRFTSRGFVLKSLGAAAVVALVVSIAVASSSTQPTNNAIRPVSLPALGVAGSTPAAFAKSAPASAGQVVHGASGPASSPASTEKIITTGTLTLSISATGLGRTVTRLQGIASELGGYVSQSDVALAGSNRGGTVVLGIPAGQFQKAIADIEGLGTVKHLATSANDVTGQVADLGAQLNALSDARTQLEALLARAGTIPALLSVENEITSTQSQIQQLQAQQRVLDSQISYSSLSVTIAPPSKEVTKQRTGFSKAWHVAITHFVNGLSAFVADSGVVLFSVLLIAVIAVLLLLAGRLVWSIVRRRLL